MEDVLRIDDVYYSTMDLSKIHPGGDTMVLMCNRQDATAIYNSSHRRPFPHEKYTKYAIPASRVKKEVLLPPYSQNFKLYFELCEKVRPLLMKSNGFAPSWYFLKVVLIAAVIVACDVYSVFDLRPIWATVLQSVFMGLAGLNLQHDANHGSVSRNPVVNRLIGMAQDYIGGSSISWMVNHNTVHHVHCNDMQRDHDLDIPLLRLHSQIPYRAHYALQQLYFVVLESCFGPLHILQNFIWIWTTSAQEPRLQVLRRQLDTSRIISIIVPLRVLMYFLHGASWEYITATIFLQYAVGGLYLAFFFLISHNFHGARKDGIDSTADDFVRNQVETSSNVAGWLLAMCNGGLNFQIEHHLFPRVHHSHYYRLAPIVEAFCHQHKIHYTHFASIRDNFASTFEHLTKLGRDPAKAE